MSFLNKMEEIYNYLKIVYGVKILQNFIYRLKNQYIKI